MTIPEPPPGSPIQIEHTVQGFRFSWKNPTSGAFPYLGVAFIACYAGGLVLVAVQAVHQLTGNLSEGKGVEWSHVFWLCVCAVMACYLAFLCTDLIRGGRPETLELEDDALAHNPGSKPTLSEPLSIPFSPLKRTKKTATSRPDVSAVRLKRVGERQRLTIDVGADRIEIGRYLREPEREWLASVLKAWREAR